MATTTHTHEHDARNLAARIGSWSARHKKRTIIGWFVFVLVAFIGGNALGTKKMDDVDAYSGESKRAQVALEAKYTQPASERVMIQSATANAKDPAFAATIKDVAARVEATGRVANVRTPFTTSDPAAVSKDGRTALIEFDVRGPPKDAATQIEPILAAVATAQQAHPDYRVEEFGGTSAEKQLMDSFEADLHKAETLSLPITLVILIVVFGALIAAGIPVLLAISAVLAAVGLVALPSRLVPVDGSVNSVILLIGMAVGVDYSLFYLKRYREERGAGHDTQTALRITSATSGRAVLISGLTVIAAMAGLFLTGDASFSAMGAGTMLVAGAAVVGSITVLPAVLALLGDRVNKGRIPFLGRRLQRRTEPRMWAAVTDRVMRRPLVFGIVATTALVALTLPALGLRTGNSGAADLPPNLPIVKTYKTMEKEFPGGTLPASVVVEADDVTAPAVTAGIERLHDVALETGKMSEPIDIVVNDAHTLAVVSIPLAGNGSDRASLDALRALRNDVIPSTIGAVAGTTVNVTGDTAANEDTNAVFSQTAPRVFAFVLALAFILLLVTFRSIVIPIKAILLNLLSVGAAYGSLVLIFQRGYGEQLLGFQSNGRIATWLPLFLFVILFGLSMDYHVFILSRVREAFDRGLTTREAVRHGVTSTAGVVTSAAVVMVAVFSIFATLSFIDMKEVGVGLAIAVLIDATVIRAVLLPASMAVLGERNWYLPRWLDWLPRISGERSVARAPQFAAGAAD